MDSQRFRQLTINLAHCAGLPADDPFIDTGALKVNGMSTLLFYDEEFDPDRLQIRFDLGEVPDDPAESLPFLHAILRVNFVFGLGGLAVFSINVNNNHVILTTQHTLAESISAQDLFFILQEAAQKAHFAWEQVQKPNATLNV